MHPASIGGASISEENHMPNYQSIPTPEASALGSGNAASSVTVGECECGMMCERVVCHMIQVIDEHNLRC